MLELWAYGLDRTSFKLLKDHLNSRTQQRDVVSPTTTGPKLNVKFHKGTMLGLLSFNIFINDLFFVVFLVVILQFCTLYSCGANLETILKYPKHDATKPLPSFQKTPMQVKSKTNFNS